MSERKRTAASTPGTPLPWIVGAFDMIWPASDIEYRDGMWREKVPEPRIIASASKGSMLPNEDRANAAYIVTACNAFPALVEALKAAKVVINMMERPDGMGDEVNAALDARLAKIDAALSAASSEGGQ